MIYEFQATQSYNGYEKPWPGGGNANMLSLDRTEIVNTGGYGQDNLRSFNEDQVWIGITASNYFLASNIVSYAIGDDYITVKASSSGYGLGFPIQVEAETSYYIGWTDGDVVSIGYFDEDGRYLSSTETPLSTSGAITTPENCAWMLVVYRPLPTVSYTYKKPYVNYPSTQTTYLPYANVCMPEGFNIWDPHNDEFIQVYAGYVNANTRELYLRPVYEEYAGEELVGPWMSSLDPYAEDTTPTEGAFVIDFGGELTSFEITPFMLQTLLDSLGIRQHFTDGAGLLNSLMDQAQGRVRSEEELLHLSRPLKVIAIGDQLPAGLTFKPISKDVLPGLPGKFIR